MDTRPLVYGSAPLFEAVGRIDLVAGMPTNIAIRVNDLDANLVGMRVASTESWDRLRWRHGTEVVYAQALGAFDTSRGGTVSLAAGGLIAQARTNILNAFPMTVIRSNATLTAEFLDTVKMLVIASPSDQNVAITPLTGAEQAALRYFVEQGGAALLMVGNDRYSSSAEVANESLLDAFGVDVTGSIQNMAAPATVVNPAASPWTSGPFGVINNYAAYYPGWFDGLPGNAVVIARLDANQQPSLALLNAGALTPQSGPVFFASEAGVVLTPLTLNALAMAGFTNRMAEWAPELQLQSSTPGTSQVQLVVFDHDAFSVTQLVSVVTWPDVESYEANTLGNLPRFSGIQLVPATAAPGAIHPSSLEAGEQVRLSWSGPPRQRFVVEASDDLIHWVEHAAVIDEVRPGFYQGLLPKPAALAPRFYRLRCANTEDAPR